jgi:signal transduction histidine kinase/ActR/RegA family two-component response regulator
MASANTNTNTHTNTEIPADLKKYINQCFKEYHIKDCLVVLPANLSLDNPFLAVTDPANRYVIKHISSTPSTEGLCINLVRDTALESSPSYPSKSSQQEKLNDDKLHDLIGEYMSRLATLVEQSTSKEPKPAAVWKHRNFLSSISHQVKTPLSAIFSGTKLIKHYTNNEYIDRICEYMNQSCVELTRYMNDIIDFYYLKQGVLVLDDTRVALGDTIDYVYENYKLQMQDAGIEFVRQIDTSIPNFIHCDELRLTQILMNLMDNAVKFSCHPAADDTIDVQTDKKIMLHAFKSSGNHNTAEKLIIHLADTGVGKIDVDNQEVYFQPFNQTTRNWLSAPDGIGLGLCLSRDFARQMGGDLRFINPAQILLHNKFTFSSEEKQWLTCIELVLPISGHKPQGSNHHQKHFPETHAVSGTTTMTQHAKISTTKDVNVMPIVKTVTASVTNQIVLIDDNHTNIELLTLILQQLGHQNIKSFTNSLTGQDYIIRNQEIITHAIIDIRMPRKHGLDLLSELAPQHKHIHFILLTALNHDDIRTVYNQIKNNNPSTRISLLFKPIDCAELKKIITVASCKPGIEKTNRKVAFV